MNANSNGSVTPVKNEDNAAANNNPYTAFFLLSLAVWYIAKAPAGKPNIITGKNPVMYIPVTPWVPVPAQKFPISLIPATSNQNTELSAWWSPVGINNLLKNAYIPDPTAPVETIALPNDTSAL